MQQPNGTRTCHVLPTRVNDRPPIRDTNDPTGKTWLVPLTRGLFAAIDAEDVPVVEGFKWYACPHRNTFYAAARGRSEDGRTHAIKMHRLIMDAPDHLMVDHKDRNRLNNRRDNLRLADGHGNARNVGLRSDNISGFKGVSFKARERKWSASIMYNGKIRQIGKFTTPEEAARAYDEKARDHFGEFAYLNFPEEIAS